MPVPVVSVAQMREWEQASWEAGRHQPEVIGQVGRLVARRAAQLARPGEIVLVLAGKGNNGADALASVPHLSDRDVRSVTVRDPVAGLAEFQSLAHLHPAVIIDGLFGIGLNRPLDEDWCNLIEAINSSGIPVLSVDLPSGLNADTGQPEGAAVRASVTLTLAAPKGGLLQATAWPYTGRLEVAPEIGLVPAVAATELQWTLPSDFAGYPPRRDAAGHKGSYGHLVIIVGSQGYHGASVLAARAASRAQPGLVTLFVQESIYAPVAAQLASTMVHVWRPRLALPESTSAILVGPGLAAPDVPNEIKSLVRELWQSSNLPLIVDASALGWLPAGPTRPGAIRVITPHPGEAARMLRSPSANVQADRLAALRELSARWGGCIVVLKGLQTLVGQAEGDVFVNPSGNPHLAQGGSGDLLSGYLGGLLAQPVLRSDPMTALRFGVWQHGAAADRLARGRANWTIEDLAGELGGVPFEESE